MWRQNYPSSSCFRISTTISAISTQTSNNPVTKNLSNLLQGQIPTPHLLQLHARILRLNLHQNNLIVTRLINHYPPNPALKIFESLENPNIFPFNTIIRILSEHGLSYQSLLIFKKLKLHPLSPNDYTFSFLLKSCSRDGTDVKYVKQLHTHVLKSGFMYDSFVGNGLVLGYVKGVKDLVSARKVFDELCKRNYTVTCWTGMIDGYAKMGLPEEALRMFVVMLEEGLEPDSGTMVSVLSACSRFKNVDVEKWVDLLLGVGGDYVNIVLVYLYGKRRSVEKSREAFDRVSDTGKRSVLCWNAMIGSYIQNGCALEGLTLFKSMVRNYDCRPNHVTMVSVLTACAEIGDLDLGVWVHEYMRSKGQRGVLSSNTNLATSLIDMYCKCGSLDSAREVFEQMKKKDVVSFNAMIMGHAVNGEGEEALILFSKMQELSLRPDSGTFLGALCACSHSGLLNKGREIFNEMIRRNSITPKLEHYACYVDLLARSGFIEEALDVVTSMPFEPNNFVWGALLGGCVIHNRLELAQRISATLVRVDPENSGGYVMLSNSFAADNDWRGVMKLRVVMREKRVVKQPGRSWINVGGVVHEFVAGSGSELGSIREVMEPLLKHMRLSSS